MEDTANFQRTYPEAPNWAVALFDKANTTFNELNSFKTRVECVERDVLSSKSQADDAKAIAYETRDQVEELEDKVNKLETSCSQLKRHIEHLEDYGRRENLKIDGLSESPNESVPELLEKVYDMFSTNLQIENARDIKIDRCHRLGRKSNKGHPRTVIVRFNWSADRDRVWGRREKLYKADPKSGISMREDYSQATEHARKVLYPYVKAAKVAKAKYTMKGSTLIIEGKQYSTDNIHEIPHKYHPVSTSTREKDDKIIFHGKESPFSNFHHAKFKVLENTFSSSEQFYQFKKAEYFKDDQTARKILAQIDPLECMKLGYKVKGFKESEWRKVDRNYMHDGNLAKFLQNPHLKTTLIDTGDKTIAESSKDSYWGTGKPIYHPTAFSDWHGNNHHGQGLMLLREQLRNT